MNKLLLATIMTSAVLLSACGSKDEAPTAAPKASTAAPASKQTATPGAVTDATAVKPQIVAPKPPPPPGGGKPAPELKPEDIARIQAMLAKQKQAAPAAPAAAAPAASAAAAASAQK